MTEDQLERFLDKVLIPASVITGCWIWTGYKTLDGYGRQKINGKMTLMHRLSFEHFVGHISKGMFVCHRCDNRKCVNPNHLFLGTNQDNIDDKVIKGRTFKKLTETQVLEIFNASASQREVAKNYGISQRQVSNIKNKKTWSHLWK